MNIIPGTNSISDPLGVTKLTNGSSWNSSPIPCPPISSTTEYPFSWAWVLIASAISPRCPHGFAAARPSSRHSSVTFTRRSARSDTCPILNIRDASEKYPLRIVDTSTLMMSPSCKMIFLSGIPWQISLLIEVHTLFGNPS